MTAQAQEKTSRIGPDKQLIVILPDDVVAASRQAEVDAATDGRKTSAADVADNVMQLLGMPSFDLLATAVKEAVKAYNRGRRGGLNVNQISRSEAAALTLPPGHPREGVLYVRHPAKPDVYYTVASFHRMAFEHKFAEAIELLMHLGANEIRVEHVEGWSRDFAAKLSVPLSAAATATVEASAARGTMLLFEAKLRGHDEPRLPESLVWYHHEPTWQAYAKGRMEFGLAEFSLAINYEDDFGINAGLRLASEKAGLELGGSFEDHVATTWKISGKFGRSSG
ncbi:hypothetical protein E4K72_15220 [Oxalobacteraceae bacterium OM1]|nr:hypothetical protein E4K72_15220 [Oxalobacteraceae bacterium OM1]